MDQAPDALRRFLAEHVPDAEILAPGMPMPTVPLAAAAIGAAEGQIVKSLLFVGKDGERVLAIAAGSARVSPARLAAVVGSGKLRLADPATVLATTGYPAGGVPPVGHLTCPRVVVDRAVAEQDTVFGGGGAEDLLLRIRPTDILRLTSGEVADVTAPTTD